MIAAAERLAADIAATLRPDRRIPEYDPLVQAALQVVRDATLAAVTPPASVRSPATR